MNMKILTLIPARGGSKGVPRKNLRLVGGRPLIEWTIEAAKGASCLGDVFVTTDDREISQVSTAAGAIVIDRPCLIAGDKTPMTDVIQHALSVCEVMQETRYDYILLLQPTAPMREAVDIDGAIARIIESRADSVISVYRVEDTHPARMYLLDNSGELVPYSQEPVGSLRQDLPNVYHRNGAIYLCTTDFFKRAGKLWGGRMLPFVMPKERSANIDDMEDLLIADFLISRKYGVGSGL